MLTKFIVRRTSERDNEKPCENAQKEFLTWLDRRSAKTLSEARKEFWFKEWYDGGTNHRVEDDHIVCDVKKKRSVWTIQINTIEELLAFITKYGEVIIFPSGYKEIPFFIEIYDTYRE